MGLITETVKVKWNGSNKKHYESLGYVYTKLGDEFEVNVKDLTKGSNAKVNCVCDGCGCNKKLIWDYASYIRSVKKDGSTYCNKCSKLLFGDKKCMNTKLKRGKSFYQWCVENKREDVISRWDYELNNCDPRDINYGTKKKYYFKCDKHPEHKSELKSINSFTNGHTASINCKQCNSIAQYILDNFPNKDLYDVWDKDKNKGFDPWNISKGNHSKKYWFICQEKEYHESYNSDCNSFSSGSRCPYCSNRNGKVHPKDSLGQYIIDTYGEDFLWDVWSDKNDKSPFEYAPKSSCKVLWKCRNKKHEDYYQTISNAVSNCDFRCPKCIEEMNCSIIEEKTKTYLKELGYEVFTEHQCTIRPINPKTKMPLPYDNEIVLSNGEHLIIEVHGSQHYGNSFFKNVKHATKEEANKLFRYQQVKDRYKKAYAEHFNYNYLELPYWVFIGKNKELYKQMIDDKIKEILHDTKAS